MSYRLVLASLNHGCAHNLSGPQRTEFAHGLHEIELLVIRENKDALHGEPSVLVAIRGIAVVGAGYPRLV
jgi:hypothetical protein